MPIDYQSMHKTFSRAAKSYHDNAVLQKEVLSRLLERLDDEAKIDKNLQPQNILDLGSGIGWAHASLKALFPSVKVTAVDFCEEMLQQIPDKTVSSVCADVHNLPFANNSFDVVFSNMLLHWSNEKDVFAECLRILKPGGLLLASCLGETTLSELKEAFAFIDDLPHVHSFPALHDLGDEMLKQGFQQVVVNAEVLTLTYDELPKLMADIKAAGGHNSDEARKKGLFIPKNLQKLCQAYEINRTDGRLPAHYEVVYVRGIKPATVGDIGLRIR